MTDDMIHHTWKQQRQTLDVDALSELVLLDCLQTEINYSACEHVLPLIHEDVYSEVQNSFSVESIHAVVDSISFDDDPFLII